MNLTERQREALLTGRSMRLEREKYYPVVFEIWPGHHRGCHTLMLKGQHCMSEIATGTKAQLLRDLARLRRAARKSFSNDDGPEVGRRVLAQWARQVLGDSKARNRNRGIRQDYVDMMQKHNGPDSKQP
jgi:hypothetical protein